MTGRYHVRGPGQHNDQWRLLARPVAGITSDGRYTITLEVPRLPAMNTSAHHHWSRTHREASEWRTWTAAVVGRRAPPRPLEHARVELVRRSASRPDYDNLVHSFKPILDGLVHAGVLALIRHSRAW